MLPEPAFFSDENLGDKIFPSILRQAGIRLETHGDHFPKGTPDQEWLSVVGKHGWVLLTLDTRLRYNRLEQQQIKEYGIAAFVLVGGSTHREKAEIFVAAKKRILRFLKNHRRPFIAKLYRDGRVEMWLDYGGGKDRPHGERHDMG